MAELPLFVRPRKNETRRESQISLPFIVRHARGAPKQHPQWEWHTPVPSPPSRRELVSPGLKSSGKFEFIQNCKASALRFEAEIPSELGSDAFQ